MIKHSVVIIAYNVEKYIGDALDSCLNQSVVPCEIVIGENCSTDGTRDILRDYQKRYPHIIKVIYHEKNLGEYGNRNYLLEHVKLEGDIINLLDADDLFKPGMFEEFNRVVDEEHVDPSVDKFIIVPNVVKLFPDGQERMFLYNYRHRYCSNFNRLRLRNRFGSRNTGISRRLYEEMPSWRSDLGMWADYAAVVEFYSRCDKFFFVDKAFPVYRIGSGITGNSNNDVGNSYELQSASVNKETLLNQSYIATLNHLKNGASIVDIVYLNKEICKTRNRIRFSLLNVVLILAYKLIDTPAALRYDSFAEIVADFLYLLPASASKVVIAKLKVWAWERRILLPKSPAKREM